MDIKDVKKVTIAGCGTEGSQISSMVAYKGFETHRVAAQRRFHRSRKAPVGVRTQADSR